MEKEIYKLQNIQQQIKPLGRTRLTEKGQELAWSAAGISVACKAQKVLLHFEEVTVDAPIYVAIYVNNCKQIHGIAGKTPPVIVENEEGITHLSVLRLSEGDVPLYLTSIELAAEDTPVLLPPPPFSKRKMLFIGDSITCGYGTEGTKEETAFYTWEEDVTHGYAFVTAKEFEADYQIVSISGQGIVKNYCGEIGRRFGDFFALANPSGSADLDQSGFDPQIVVVNGGTNDMACVADEDFAVGVHQFLTTLRETYPKAEIVWIYGAMGIKFSPVLESVFEERKKNDNHLSFCSATPIYGKEGFVGAGGHPTYLAQQYLAKELVAHINSRKGEW